MKKYFILAIAALGAFALASCSNEKENPVAPAAGATVSVTLNADNTKATMTDPTSDGAGFVFQTGDVINWVSDSGNATATYTGDDANVINLEMTIPGLDQGNVSGYFAVNFTDVVPFSYNASNATQSGEGANTDCFFAASKTQTLAKGTTSVSPKVMIVGGLLAFQFANDEATTVMKVEIEGSEPWFGNGVYDGENLTYDQTLSKVAVSANVVVTGDEQFAEKCVFIPVPGDIPTPNVYVYATDAKHDFYFFDKTGICPDTNLEISNGQVKKFKLSLYNHDNHTDWELGEVELTDECITSNDPMQYVVGGYDTGTYGLNTNPNNFFNITSEQKTARENKYGKASNLWDEDAATCYHTNLDWGEPNSSWGQRTYSINTSRTEKRYIQVTLPSPLPYFDLTFDNADSGKAAEGLELLVSADGTNFSTFDASLDPAFSAHNEVEDVKIDGNTVKAFRIRNTKWHDDGNGWETTDWTFVKAAFGIAELTVSGPQVDIVDPGKVTNVALDKSSVNVYIGKAGVTLNATVFPTTADVKDIDWTSSDPSVATVADGVVTAVGEGTAVITAKTVDGGFTASCDVTSAEPSAHKVFTIGAKGSDMQFNAIDGWKYVKFPGHSFEESGAWANYVEFVQEGTSYYLADFAKLQNISNIAQMSIITASNAAGEDYTIPCSGNTGQLFTWVTSGGGVLSGTTTISVDQEMLFVPSPDGWSGTTDNVSSTLTQGSKYASILYNKSSNSCNWKLIEVSETEPE